MAREEEKGRQRERTHNLVLILSQYSARAIGRSTGRAGCPSPRERAIVAGRELQVMASGREGLTPGLTSREDGIFEAIWRFGTSRDEGDG